jgi:hypothetical protein
VTYSYYLERGGADAALFVEEERAVLHARDGEEAYVLVSRDLVRRGARRVVGRRHAARRAHDVEVVRHQRLVGDEDEELEVLDDRYLSDLLVRDDLSLLVVFQAAGSRTFCQPRGSSAWVTYTP